MLKCPKCNSILKLDIAYSGCDWDTQAGQGSGYGWEVSLHCQSCGRLFTIGHIKDYNNFEELKPELRCVK